MPCSIVLRRVSVPFSARVILAIAILFASPAKAQVAGATLSGTVSDPSGAAIAGADVSILNTATGVVRSLTTNPVGYYSAPNLLPGSYEVIVKAQGFSSTKESGIGLEVGAEQVLNVPLKIGEATQVIEVTGGAQLVQLSSSL